MPGRRKRSASSRASKRKKRHNKALARDPDKPPEKHENVPMETNRSKSTKQLVWKKIKTPFQLFEMPRPVTPSSSMRRSFLPRFSSADQLAEWVFNVAKHRAVQLNLSLCIRSEDVRDALLKKFHRWPETKIARAVGRFKTLNQEAEQKCQEQVQLYIHELRSKLLAGTSALFWLDILQPLKYPAMLPRPEVREVLVALLDEVRSIDGLFELLEKTNERLWAVLTLPLKLEPLFRGVSALAVCGHQVSANEAMQLLMLYAEQYTAFPSQKKRGLPLGLSVVASVAAIAPLEVSTSNLNELPGALREKLALPLTMIIPDWIAEVGAALDILEKTLTARWAACERAPFEEELKTAVQTALQEAFKRLTHALATDQLYAMRNVGRERSSANGEDPLTVSVVSEGEMLLPVVQTHSC